MTNSDLIQSLISQMQERIDDLHDVTRSIDKSGEMYPNEEAQFKGRIKELKRTIKVFSGYLLAVN
jgi:hypothetical protein